MNVSFDELIGGALIVIAILLGLGSVFGLALLSAYTFLADGVWHWFTLADLVEKLGRNPTHIVDPYRQWEWVGAGKIVKWIFYSAPAAVVGLGISFLIGAVGASFSD